MRFGGIVFALAAALGSTKASALPADDVIAGAIGIQVNVPSALTIGALSSAGGFQLSLETRGWRGEWVGWGLRLAGGAEFKRPEVLAPPAPEWFLGPQLVLEVGRLSPRGGWATGLSAACGPVARFSSGLDLMCSVDLFFAIRSDVHSSVTASLGLQGASRFDATPRPVARISLGF